VADVSPSPRWPWWATARARVGIGYGKANEVPDAIKKGTANAHKHSGVVKLKGDTIPHDVYGQYDGGRVLLRPASPGTGLIAGGGVRAVLEAAGVKNILTKSMGSSNHIAVVHATLDGLRKLRLAEDVCRCARLPESVTRCLTLKSESPGSSQPGRRPN
jgi:small subunit ribosomal protein S5